MCYINADINAAQNLAKRWLTRYDNPQKLNVKIIDSNVLPVCDNSVRINRIIGPSCLNIDEGNIADKRFSGVINSVSKKVKKNSDSHDNDIDGDEELGICNVFRDYSNTFLDANRWYSSLKFWETVKSKINNLVITQPIIINI